MLSQGSNWLHCGAPQRTGRRQALGLGLAVAAVAVIAAAEDSADQPRATWVTPPAVVRPGEPLRLHLQWRLPPEAEPDSAPASVSPAAWLTWDRPVRTPDGVSWEGEVVPLRSGPLDATITCSAVLPELPSSLPAATHGVVPWRFLVNLYSPCRYVVRTQEAALPAMGVSPMPTPPGGSAPYVGLIGEWAAELAMAPARPVLGKPFRVSLRLSGRGSMALLSPPTLAHPDVEVGEPTVVRDPAGGNVCIEWPCTAARLPLAPLRVALSTFDGAQYVAHHLEAGLAIEPDRPERRSGLALPAVLATFHSLPSSRTRGLQWNSSAGLAIALLGTVAGLVLAGLARRRDARLSPLGVRQAAARRLRRALITHIDQLPTVHHDLRLCVGLPAGASAEEIASALRPQHPDLADVIQEIERQRFAQAATAVLTCGRLTALLRRLPVLVGAVLTLCLAGASPVDPALAGAETAFRCQSYVEAVLALTRVRRRVGDSPELLMDLGNALWFSGRQIEGLALYERALRLAPRRADIRAGVAWLRARHVPDTPATASAYPRPWRDWLCPSEWFTAAGLALGLGAFGAGLQCWRRRSPVGVLVGTAGAACLCLSMAFSQRLGPYRLNTTMRLTEPLALRVAPVASAESTDTRLPAGAIVVPGETRAGWVLVRTPVAEGWVPESCGALVW